ncbi:hypothetical protein ACVWWG_002248 [Bradyrhizobium sp. LB7.2]
MIARDQLSAVQQCHSNSRSFEATDYYASDKPGEWDGYEPDNID